ncbi:hypothetical protein PV783_12365 [Chitinophaga sp. CC14]|uniref:hypothetical protein n=1 Tax=Chitinophaga sp. CC14 TaxID=3029199 RepID=UPI003B80F55B
MTKNIQQKTDKIIQLAATSTKVNKPVEDTSAQRLSNDSLSMSIRNKKEADLFLAALNAVIKIARHK